MKLITAEWKKTGIGVIAVLGFLVAGAVSAHAADLGLDCPEDNTYTPSPPPLLKKNVTPYTYTPIPKTVAPSGLEKTCPNYAALPAHTQKFTAKVNDPKVFTPNPEADLKAWCGYMLGYLGQGAPLDSDGECSMYSIHTFLSGQPGNLFGVAGTHSEVMQMVRLAWAQDIVEVGYARMDYAAIEKAKTGSVTSLTGDDQAFEDSIRSMFLAGWDDVVARKAKAGYDWSGSVASFAPRMIDNFTTYYCKSKAAVPAATAVPKGITYYHDLLQPLNSVQLPPGKYTWTDTEMQFSAYALTTASNLGLKDADGNIIPGASSVFNKWGLHGQCGGNNGDCIVVNAYMTGANLPYYASITDQLVKVNTIVTDYLEWFTWMKEVWLKAGGVPPVPKFSDWVDQKYKK